MEIKSYWDKLTNKLTLLQVERVYPQAVAAAREYFDPAALESLGLEWAYDLYPAFGPAGAFSDEDAEAYPDADDDDYDLPKTVSGKRGLFCYSADTDELYDLQFDKTTGECEGPIMWNY